MTATVGEALRRLRQRLEHAGMAEAPLEADLLLSLSLGVERTLLYAALAEDFLPAAQVTLEALVQRRLLREPMAYLLGKREFFGLEFKLRPGVFVPRPETESLVEQAIALVRTRLPRGSAVVADVGTGAGIIAISMASALPHSHFYATDISETALSVARSNADTHGTHPRTAFLKGDLLAPLPGPVDVVVANLPYIPRARIAELEPEVRCFEPIEALDGGEDGLHLVRRLLHQASHHLRPGGAILLELDPDQMEAATATVLEAYPQARLGRARDLAGQERVLVVRP